MHLGHDARRAVLLRPGARGRPARPAPSPSCCTRCPRLALPQLLQGRWDDSARRAPRRSSWPASVGQPALTAVPLAWLALLAALQGDPAYEEHRQAAAAAGARHLGVLHRPVPRPPALGGSDRRRPAPGTPRSALHDYRGGARAGAAPDDRRRAGHRRGARRRASAQAQAELDRARRLRRGDRGRPWALAAAEHGRAVLAPADRAAEHFACALVHHRHSGRAGRPGPDPAGVRRAAAARRSAGPTRAPTCAPPSRRFDDVGAEPLAAPGPRRAPRLRGDGPQARPVDARGADPDGGPGRPPGRAGPVQQGRRRAAVDLAADGRVPPARACSPSSGSAAEERCPRCRCPDADPRQERLEGRRRPLPRCEGQPPARPLRRWLSLPPASSPSRPTAGPGPLFQQNERRSGGLPIFLTSSNGVREVPLRPLRAGRRGRGELRSSDPSNGVSGVAANCRCRAAETVLSPAANANALICRSEDCILRRALPSAHG